MTRRVLAMCAAAAVLSACGARRLPVSLEHCQAVPAAGGFTISATAKSDAYKPVRGIRAVVDFYHDFRYGHFIAEAELSHELDPHATQHVTLIVANPAGSGVRGAAMRCTVTHLDYLDGTSATLPTAN